MASRHLSRSIAMQSLYEWDFSEGEVDLKEVTERNINQFGPGLKENKAFVWSLVVGVIDHQKEIDAIIKKTAPQWPIDQISIVDRNVLRLGIYELLYADKEAVPEKVKPDKPSGPVPVSVTVSESAAVGVFEISDATTIVPSS